MARLSPEYRRYMRSPRWRAAKAHHWRSPLTWKSCIVCGARRGERRMDHHHLAYRKRRDGEMADPRWYELVPACAYPCHRWLITPLSRTPFLRGALFVGLAVLALWLDAPPLETAGATAAAILLPRVPEATFLCFALGLPVRVGRWVGRLAR